MPSTGVTHGKPWQLPCWEKTVSVILAPSWTKLSVWAFRKRKLTAVNQWVLQKKIRHLTAKRTRKLIISFQLSCLEKKNIKIKKNYICWNKIESPSLTYSGFSNFPTFTTSSLTHYGYKTQMKKNHEMKSGNAQWAWDPRFVRSTA